MLCRKAGSVRSKIRLLTQAVMCILHLGSAPSFLVASLSSKGLAGSFILPCSHCHPPPSFGLCESCPPPCQLPLRVEGQPMDSARRLELEINESSGAFG